MSPQLTMDENISSNSSTIVVVTEAAAAAAALAVVVSINQSINQSINHYFSVHLKVDQRAGQRSQPHTIGVTVVVIDLCNASCGASNALLVPLRCKTSFQSSDLKLLLATALNNRDKTTASECTLLTVMLSTPEIFRRATCVQCTLLHSQLI